MDSNSIKIGDCLLLETEQKKYLGLILIQIVKTIEYKEYIFLLSGQKFDYKPTIDEFIQSGVFGRKIPSGVKPEEIEDRSFIKKKKYSKRYDQIRILGKELGAIIP